MREIKFRAWDEKRKRMFEPYTGNFGVKIPNKNFFVGINGNGLEVSEYEGKGYWRVLPVMQYTGLSDKNGKGIYEGDIFGKESHWSFYVGFKDGCFVMIPCEKVQRINWTWHPIGQNMIEGWEVIGNIYENPNLLEGTTP